MALAWTGSELVSLGGAVPGVGRPARDGYAFRSPYRTLEPHPARPGTGQDRCLCRVDGKRSAARRRIQPPQAAARERRARPRHQQLGGGSPRPPHPAGRMHAAKVWTGRTLIVWGGHAGSTPADQERRTCRPRTGGTASPMRRSPLKSPSAAWTGSQMIVFGSSIGASYDPHTNTWQRLPPSTLAPEASSIGWIGRRLVAWDYEGNTQSYSPATNRWSATTANPFGFGECYPQSVATATSMFAWFCGEAATVGAQTEQLDARLWRRHRPHRPYGGTRLKQFQTASLAPAGAVIAIAATGVVVKHGGPCFGCKARPSRTGCTARSPRALSIGRCRCASPRHCTSLLGNSTRASGLATHDSATRSRSPQPGPDAQSSPGISRWMAGTAGFECRSDSRRDVPRGAVRRARARSGVTNLVRAHHQAHPRAG